MDQGRAPKGILLSWSLKYEADKWGKKMGMGMVGKREQLLSWKTEGWGMKGGVKKARWRVEGGNS